MIDENSHCSQQATEVTARTICFLLENVHPSKVFLTSTGIASSFSSQEPRRPRFSFFYLHNFKELTSLPSRARTSLEALASTFFQGTGVSVRLPGRSSALSEIAEQWERLALGVVNVAGCSRDVFVCQHPIFDFRFLPNFENQKISVAWNLHTEIANFLVISVVCFPARRRLAPRPEAMTGL